MDELLKIIQTVEPVSVVVLSWVIWQLVGQIKTMIANQQDIMRIILEKALSEEEIAAVAQRYNLKHPALSKYSASDYD